MRKVASRRLPALLTAALFAAAAPASALTPVVDEGAAPGERQRLDHDRGERDMATLEQSRLTPPGRSLPRTDPMLVAPPGADPARAVGSRFEPSLPRPLLSPVQVAGRGARAPPSAAV